MQVVGDRTGTPPYILGNFPKIEICFVCTDTKPDQAAQASVQKDVYAELLKLDDLRKKGLLTDAEFEVQKKKILAGN